MLTFTRYTTDSVRAFRITEADAAALLRAEERGIIRGATVAEDGRRCLFGVLEGWHRGPDWRPVPEWRISIPDRDRLWPLWLECVRFDGTPQERAALAAERLQAMWEAA